MHQAVIIDLSNSEVCKYTQMKIWNHFILERLVIILKQCGVFTLWIKVNKENLKVMNPSIKDFLSQQSVQIIFSKTRIDQTIPSLPGHLVCSTKFLRAWIKSGIDFQIYSADSPYVYLLCTDNKILREAKRKLFKDSKKETDGWVSQKINAKLSIPISRFLSHFPSIHPNWITFLNLPLALLGPWLFLGDKYLFAAFSGLVFQLGSVLDGCDGEIARTKLQVTKLGGWLDTALDNFSYIAFFFAVGVYQSKVKANPFYFQAFIIGLSCLLAALVATYLGMRKLGTQTHHAYRQAFISLSKSSRVLSFINRLNFLSKREYFALGIMFLCLLNLRSTIYWILLCALFLYSTIVIATFPKIYKNQKT